MKKEKQDGREYDDRKTMTAYDLLVIDDICLMNLNLEQCRTFFEIIEARDCRKSIMLISQLSVAQ